MLIIDSEKKQQKWEILEQIKIYFLRVISVVLRFFGGMPLYIITVYLSGTEEPSPWLGPLSLIFLEFRVSGLKCVSQPGLRSFYKRSSKNLESQKKCRMK